MGKTGSLTNILLIKVVGEMEAKYLPKQLFLAGSALTEFSLVFFPKRLLPKNYRNHFLGRSLNDARVQANSFKLHECALCIDG